MSVLLFRALFPPFELHRIGVAGRARSENPADDHADEQHRRNEDEVPGRHRITVGADKAYDTADFIAETRAMKVTPHVARNINAHRGSNIDGRTTRHAG